MSAEKSRAQGPLDPTGTDKLIGYDEHGRPEIAVTEEELAEAVALAQRMDKARVALSRAVLAMCQGHGCKLNESYAGATAIAIRILQH